MDLEVRRKLDTYCSDLLELLVDLLPENLTLVEVDDSWLETTYFFDERYRSLRFVSHEQDIPSIEIAQDIVVSATGDGWTVVEEEDEDGITVLENDDSVLAVSSCRYQSEDAIRLDIEQKWPSDVHPPVQMSELFIQACQNIIQLHDFPISLQKDLCFDLSTPDLIRTCFERVQYRFDENIDRHLIRSGYKRSTESKDRWNQTSLEDHQRFQAEVLIDSEQKTLAYSLLKIDQSLTLLD